jgi:hypothetical protein
MRLYLLEHAKTRWQVWLILSPNYLLFVVFAVILGEIAFHQYEKGQTTNAAIDVVLIATCAVISIYGLRITVRRAAAMFPGPNDTAPTPHPPSSARVVAMQTYMLGTFAALGAASTVLQVATGHLGVAIVNGAGALYLGANAIATRTPARPATSNQIAVRAALGSVSFCAVILAVVLLATGHPIGIAPFIAISFLALALRIWMLRGQPYMLRGQPIRKV